MTQPPIVPGPDPVPPRIVYVQQDPRLASQAVSSGILSGLGTGVVVLLAVCVGIPLMLFAGWMVLAGIGWLSTH